MSFLEIFQPGLRHLREERERQRMDVAHPTNGADPLVEIDLDAGTARIVMPSRGRPAAEESAKPAEGAQPGAEGPVAVPPGSAEPGAEGPVAVPADSPEPDVDGPTN